MKLLISLDAYEYCKKNLNIGIQWPRVLIHFIGEFKDQYKNSVFYSCEKFKNNFIGKNYTLEES